MYGQERQKIEPSTVKKEDKEKKLKQSL